MRKAISGVIFARYARMSLRSCELSGMVDRLNQKSCPMPSDEIEVVSPPGAIKPTGTWSLGVRAGDFVFVAGMRGIDPATNMLVDGAEARIRQAFLNMKTIVEAAGGTLRNTVRLVIYVTDMYRYRPMVNKIQEELWAGAPYPPRSIVEVNRLNQDDIVEVEGTFFCPVIANI
jgi:2-iminobutanoate/2-iminopropanoate deaminase